MFTYLITEEKAYGITVTVINKVINKIKHVGRICLISWKFNKSNYFHILMLLKVFKNCTFSFSFLNQTFKPTPSFSSSNSSSENPWFCFNLELAPKTFWSCNDNTVTLKWTAKHQSIQTLHCNIIKLLNNPSRLYHWW